MRLRLPASPQASLERVTSVLDPLYIPTSYIVFSPSKAACNKWVLFKIKIKQNKLLKQVSGRELLPPTWLARTQVPSLPHSRSHSWIPHRHACSPFAKAVVCLVHHRRRSPLSLSDRSGARQLAIRQTRPADIINALFVYTQPVCHVWHAPTVNVIQNYWYIRLKLCAYSRPSAFR